jgi:small subunit ribosomal protein S4e
VKLKRLLAPKFWKIKRKVATWVVTPRAGPHKKFECIPLAIIVRDILKLTETGREAKKTIKKGEIFVDGEVKKDYRYPAGLMDVLSLPRIKKNYRIVISRKGLKLVEITEDEAKIKICKIVGKTKVKRGLTQLNLHDGRNLLVKKDVYKVGDSLLIELPIQKVISHLPLRKDYLVVALKGKKAGKLSKVKKILPGSFATPPKVKCEFEGKEVEILKEHIMIVGKEKPVVRVHE